MVKLKGPGCSTEAAGSIADILTFANNNNRAALRKYAKPADRKTPKQRSIRAITKFLSQQWKVLPPADRATWEAIAARGQHAPYHAFMRQNHVRWTNWRRPAKVYPGPEGPPTPAPQTLTAWGTFRTINLRIWLNPGCNLWGQTLHITQTNGFTPGRENVWEVVPHDGVADLNHKVYDMPAGTYYVRVIPFTDVGKPGLNSAQRTVVVT